ncbi:MAG: hypothetical protein JSU68_14390 [Phycisphaerales bacterium]|nr:MAG: hypothetical protein JSU68_14390 [Phycisphaerales bacterium]
MTDIDNNGILSSPDSAARPASPLLARLWGASEESDSNEEWRRADRRRKNCSGVRLELQRQNGTVYNVRLHNVSHNGVCVICPKKIRQADIVKLRCQGESVPDEAFKVVHVTSTVGGFKLGLTLLRD